MDVSVFLEPTIDLKRLAEILDGLGHEGRMHTVATWHKKRQIAIFDAAKANGPIDLDFYVPPSIGMNVDVMHEGTNTLPLFTRVEKHFMKTEIEGKPVIVGYNNIVAFQNAFAGPGYYTAVNGEGEHEGEVAIDYNLIPKVKHPSWPAIVPNAGFPLRGVVYGTMIDYMRKVSNHVSIGHASKGGKFIDAWFTIVRKDVD